MRLGVCYYPEHWPESMWEDDARRMKALGIAQVRIGEFAWSRIEPEAGQLQWAWLDRAIDVLGAAGLEVVMSTPTATPPKWLIDLHPDILPVGADGRARAFGSRRHYDFSSNAYFEASQRIVTLLAERYGNHPAVTAWQTDNEYGCHQTVVSYSADAVARFRDWLRARYTTIAALNAAWGTVFWSMEYTSFEQIDAPVGTVTEAHPSHRMDYRRFASSEVARYNRMQVEILRRHAPGRVMVHNFMQNFFEFDHYPVAADLDAATWDSYPLGALEEFWFSPKLKARWLRTGHPDFASFNHDLYRGMSKQPFWVMEQQPGPVNWAKWNPAPLPGMVRLWSWEAFAHGAGCVSYFRWRQCPFGQEQLHAGLNTPDNLLDIGGAEAAQVAQELQFIVNQNATVSTKVALVFDYEAKWLFEVHPQAQDFQYGPLVFEYYSALRSLGFDVDVIPTSSNFDGYRLIVVPPLPVLPDDLPQRLQDSGAHVVFAPRSGSKTVDLCIPANLGPGPLAQQLPMRVWRVDAMRPTTQVPVQWGERQGQARIWRDLIEVAGDTTVVATFDDGHPAIVRSGNLHYLAGIFDEPLLRDYLTSVAREAGLPVARLADGTRISRRGDLTYVFNYGDAPLDASPPPGARFVFGTAQVPPQGVSVFQS